MGCVQDRGCSKSPGATWGEPSPQRQRPSSARDSATDGPHSSSRALNARKANDFQTHVHTAQGGGGNGKAETHNRQAWGKRGQPTPGPCVFPRSHSRSSVHRNLQGPPFPRPRQPFPAGPPWRTAPAAPLTSGLNRWHPHSSTVWICMATRGSPGVSAAPAPQQTLVREAPLWPPRPLRSEQPRHCPWPLKTLDRQAHKHAGEPPVRHRVVDKSKSWKQADFPQQKDVDVNSDQDWQETIMKPFIKHISRHGHGQVSLCPMERRGGYGSVRSKTVKIHAQRWGLGSQEALEAGEQPPGRERGVKARCFPDTLARSRHPPVLPHPPTRKGPPAQSPPSQALSRGVSPQATCSVWGPRAPESHTPPQGCHPEPGAPQGGHRL